MGSKKDPTMSQHAAGNITPAAKELGGKKLQLNKQTLQDLSPTDAAADKVRGGATKVREVPDKTYEQQCK